MFGYYTGVARIGFKYLEVNEIVTFELYYDTKRYSDRAINIRGIWGTDIVWNDFHPYLINPNVLDGLYNNDTGYLHHVPTGIFRGRAYWICAACGTETFKQRDICRGCNVVNRAEIKNCGDSVAARNEIKRRLIPQYIEYPQCQYCKKKHLGACLHCFTCGGLHREPCNEALVLKEQLRGTKQPYWKRLSTEEDARKVRATNKLRDCTECGNNHRGECLYCKKCHFQHGVDIPCKVARTRPPVVKPYGY